MLDGRIVRLEPLGPEHEESLFQAAGPTEIWPWLHAPPLGQDRDVWSAWLADATARAAAGEQAAWATVDAHTGAAIGSTRFMTLRPDQRGLEIGWTWLTPSAWHSGANIEAKLLQLTYAFETLGCQRVELKTHEHNQRSRGAMERMGATYEGILRKYQVTPGIGPGWRNSAFYSVIDDEWPAVRASLQARLARYP